MATARHTAEGDASFRVSLLRNLGGAVGLVALSAAVFGVLGMIGRADPPQVTAGEEATDDAADEAADGAGDDAGTDADPNARDDSPDQGVSDADDGTEDVTDDDDAAGDTDADAADAADAGAADDGAVDDDGAAAPDDQEGREDDTEAGDDEADGIDDTAADQPSEDPRIDPASVTVQVLDGYQQDGGVAARALAEELRGDGYRVIAENPALRYDATTVLWATPDGEAAARQVAADIGASEVREQPGNLSTSVAVHVVVGADRG